MARTKRTVSFLFKTDEDAKNFLKQVRSKFPNLLSQQPHWHGKVDFLRVLVTYSGSLNYDIVVDDYLEDLLIECNGVRQP